MSSPNDLLLKRGPATWVGATLVLFLCLPGVARGQGQCGGLCPISVSPIMSVFPNPNIIVGSPSGLVASYTFIFRDDDGNGVQREAWLGLDPQLGCAPANLQLFTSSANGHEPDGTKLECGEDTCTEWPYLGKLTELSASPHETGRVTFHPRFGGHGCIVIQYQLPCPCHESEGFCIQAGYADVASAEGRSTDFDADGNTDQNDKLELGAALTILPASSRPLYYDLTLDGVVDAADYRLVATEMVIEWNGGSVAGLYKCPGPCHACPAVPVGNEEYFVDDKEPPAATVLHLSVAGGNATLTWTSPGDHANPSTGLQNGVAKEFDIRYSASPITAANFDAATAVSGVVPPPDLPGTQHTKTVPTANFFAIRTIDYSGNKSEITSVTMVGNLAVSFHCAVEIVGQNGVIDPHGVDFVHVEENGQPKSGVLVELSFLDATEPRIALSQPEMQLQCSSSSRRLGNVTDANGNAKIHVLGGASIATGCTPDPILEHTGFGLYVNGSFSQVYLPYRSFDLTGDQTLDPNDLSSFLQKKGCSGHPYYPAVDYDGNGSIGDSDQARWLERFFEGTSAGPGGATCGPSKPEALEALPLVTGITGLRPNPTSGDVDVDVALASTEAGKPLELAVYDVAGRRVMTLSQTLGPGRHTLRWDGRNAEGRRVSAGIYFLRLSGSMPMTKRVMVIR